MFGALKQFGIVGAHCRMKFLAPWFFWSFLALIPLVAVYFLKVRPRRKETTAYFLWQKVFTEKKATSLFTRLRDLLSLLLMALVFGSVALALTKPELTDDSRKDLLILIDNSASMSAGSGRSQRLMLAKEAAVDLIKGLDGAQRAAVGTVSGDLRFLSHMTDDPRALLDAVDLVEPTDFELQTDAMKSLHAGKSEEWMKGHRVILVSDGCFAEGKVPEKVELLKVGEPLENAGVVSADAQYLPGSGNRLGVYFKIASSYKQPVKADLIVKPAEGEGIAKLIPLDIQPGINNSETFTVDEAEPGRWLLRLDLKDALERDNEAHLAVARPKPIRVMVDAENKFFLETCVQAFASAGGLFIMAEENPQLVLAKGKSPAVPLAMIFQPQGDSPWWKSVGEPLDNVVPRVKLAEHPVLRHCDASGINFAGARKIVPLENALVLVESDQGTPLIYVASSGGKTALVVNLDPAAAEFYFSAAFPVLVHGAATHLSGREESLLATYSPGSTIPLPGVREGEPTNVIPPDGTSVQTRERRFGPLLATGFYSLTNASGEWLAGCSLMAPAESLLDNSGIATSLQPIAKGWPPYLLLTLVAVVLLILESLLYHRRKVG